MPACGARRTGNRAALRGIPCRYRKCETGPRFGGAAAPLKMDLGGPIRGSVTLDKDSRRIAAQRIDGRSRRSN